MSNIVILMASTKGGLTAAARRARCVILPNTTCAFESINTFTDVAMKDEGEINTEKSGWIALGEVQ